MKSLSEIVADNTTRPPVLTPTGQALEALRVARASLTDVVDRPIPRQQADNIRNVDIPIIDRAILRLL